MKTNKASGLVIAVILLFVIIGMVVTLSSITILETKIGQKTKSSVGAFYNSEACVEYALNQIANSDGTKISDAFSGFVGGAIDEKKTDYGCYFYLLDQNGKVIISDDDLASVKSVRSVGIQGGETQRAIEAAVAAPSGGGGCYVSYGSPPANAAPAPDQVCLLGFVNKGNLGRWGRCGAGGGFYWLPPAASCPNGTNTDRVGDAFLCCQN